MERIQIFQTFDEYYQATRSEIFTKNPDFHIFRYADLSPATVTRMGLFRLTYYQFCLAEESESIINISSHSVTSGKQQLIIFSPGQLSQWQKIGNWKGYLVFVKESFLRLYSQNSNSRLTYGFLSSSTVPILSLEAEEYLEFSGLCERMIYELNSANKESLHVIENYLQIFLVYVRRLQERILPQAAPDPVNPAYAELHSKFLKLLKERYLESKSVSEFASSLNITPGYLNECVKRVTGKSAKALINEMILMEAKSLLLQTTIPIKEIAFRLNFDDYPHFVKFFKGQTNYTPAQFRQLP